MHSCALSFPLFRLSFSSSPFFASLSFVHANRKIKYLCIRHRVLRGTEQRSNGQVLGAHSLSRFFPSYAWPRLLLYFQAPPARNPHRATFTNRWRTKVLVQRQTTKETRAPARPQCGAMRSTGNGNADAS